jgi:hypothetical protein
MSGDYLLPAKKTGFKINRFNNQRKHSAASSDDDRRREVLE